MPSHSLSCHSSSHKFEFSCKFSMLLNIINIIFFAFFRLTNSSYSQYTPHPTTRDTYTEKEATTPIADYEDVNVRPTKSKVLGRLFGADYDWTIRPPGKYGYGPTEVKLGMYLRSLDYVDDNTMQYSAQITLYIEWMDPRLQYNHISSYIQYLQLDEQKFWKPTVLFKNEKSGNVRKLMAENQYAWLYPDGKILQIHRIGLVISCPMNLRSYPLDVQTCPTQIITTYQFRTRDLLLSWRSDNPIMLAGDLNTPRFTLEDWYASTCTYKEPTGNYSCLQLEITFAREFGFYLIQIYVPCSMLVIVSWLPFLLEPTAVEARVSLGVTTILTIVTLIYGINQNTPPTSYAKALDVWTSFCMGMVFAALFQFSSVNYVYNVQWVKARTQLAQQKNDKKRGD